MLLHAARLSSRVAEPGTLVSLQHQDRSLWDRALLSEGMLRLRASARGEAVSRYHIESGLAAAHAMAPSWEETDWTHIVRLYDVLSTIAPTDVTALNRAIAVGWRDGADAGLRELDAIESTRLEAYPFVHAARAECLLRMGDHKAALASWSRALAVARSPEETEFLFRRRNEAGTE